MEAMELKEIIAKDLLDIGAVSLRPEIRCDAGLTLTDVDIRDDVAIGLSALIRSYYPGAEALMGAAGAGEAYAAVIAHMLRLPMGYVRSGAIGGKLLPGRKVVLVEDLVRTGGRVLGDVETLRAHGADVLGAVSIFSFETQKGLAQLAAANVEHHSLTDLDTLAPLAAAAGHITPEDASELLRSRDGSARGQ